jgi:hypothetical protein
MILSPPPRELTRFIHGITTQFLTIQVSVMMIRHLNAIHGILYRHAERTKAHPMDVETAIHLAMDLLMRQRTHVKNCIRIGKLSIDTQQQFRRL